MSRIFSISPRSGHRPLTMGQLMALGPADLRPYNIDFDHVESFLAASPAQLVSKWGIDPYSSRGFELEFSGGAYRAIVSTPSSPNDWRITLDFLAALAGHLDAPILDEDGTAYSPDSITAFPFARDIGIGLASLQTSLDNGNTVMLDGVRRRVAVTPAMLRRITGAPSPADEFGETLRVIQQLDAYDASQMVARSPKGEILGMYTITQSVRTILPLAPTVSRGIREQIGANTAVDWRINLIACDGPSDRAESYVPAGDVAYREAVERLPRDKVRVLDGASMLIEALDRDELDALRA